MFYVNAEDGAVMQMDKFGRGVPVIISSGYVFQEVYTSLSFVDPVS